MQGKADKRASVTTQFIPLRLSLSATGAKPFAFVCPFPCEGSGKATSWARAALSSHIIFTGVIPVKPSLRFTTRCLFDLSLSLYPAEQTEAAGKPPDTSGISKLCCYSFTRLHAARFDFSKSVFRQGPRFALCPAAAVLDSIKHEWIMVHLLHLAWGVVTQHPIQPRLVWIMHVFPWWVDGSWLSD